MNYTRFSAPLAIIRNVQIPIRVAGVWMAADPTNPFWFYPPETLSVAESDLFRQDTGSELTDAYLASVASATQPPCSQQISDENSWLGYPVFWLYGAYDQIVTGQSSVEEALGEAQQLADEYCACVIAARPALILADEPTGELDSATGQQILQLFHNIVDWEGATVLIATHDLAVDAFADEVIHLEDGRIAETLVPANV